MNSNGDICPYCGDILPEDGSPCPACRHLHERGLPDGVDLDTVAQEHTIVDNTEVNDGLCDGHPSTPCTSESPKSPEQFALDSALTNPCQLGAKSTSCDDGGKGDMDVQGQKGCLSQSPRKRRRKRHYVKALLMQQPTLDRNEPTSTCIVCGTLHFRAALSSCPRCGGICKVMTLDEIDWMARLNPNLAYLPRL